MGLIQLLTALAVPGPFPEPRPPLGTASAGQVLQQPSGGGGLGPKWAGAGTPRPAHQDWWPNPSPPPVGQAGASPVHDGSRAGGGTSGE